MGLKVPGDTSAFTSSSPFVLCIGHAFDSLALLLVSVEKVLSQLYPLLV
jgi:hypothetical protein